MRACDCPPSLAGDDAAGGCPATSQPPTLIMCGRSTSSKTKPTTAGRCGSRPSPTSTPEKRSPPPTARRLGADQTVQALEQVAWLRGHAPRFIRCDNGPELVSQALQDWCRFNATTTAYIEPGAPWQNPYAESFNGHLRRELLDMESFNTLHEAQLLVEDWRLEYNHYRPHQSLDYQTPAEYARRWRTETQPAPS
jgi:hypothetical protein